jgi:signal transduction histidine kinase
VAEVPEETRAVWSPTSRARELVQLLSIRSYMAVPLIIRGQVIGAITLTTSSSGRRFNAADAALAEEFARRAAVAMDNADLHHELTRANRLKDEFLATFSHELRTPLTAILGWVHLLRKGKPAQMGRALETIERNALVQARIVDDVLDVSAIIMGKLRLDLQPADLAQICRAALDTVRPSAQAKNIRLLENLDATLGPITGDPARLQQVVWNLLANAIKFTPTNGHVTVALENKGLHAELRVSDDGQGIAAHLLPHVFERYWQADSGPSRSHGGLGLGLSIVRYLVERHGGHVAVASEGEGRGATFTVTLPMQRVGDEPS